jgi:hypothetical protein
MFGNSYSRWILSLALTAAIGAASLAAAFQSTPSEHGAPKRSRGDNRLIGYWKLDEVGPGSLVADVSANQWHGRCDRSKPEACAPGKLGTAFRFPAAGTVSLDRHAAALGRLGDFTLSLWIQYSGGASRQMFSLSDGTLNHRIQVEVHNECLQFGWQDGGAFSAFGIERLAWKPGTWYHVVFVNDSRSGKTILRSNDLAWKGHPNTLSPAGLKSPTKRVEIGSLNGQYAFNGSIDEVRLFDTALPLSDQLALYESLRGTPADPQWQAAKTALVERETSRRNHGFYARLVREDARLSVSERQRKLDWLFQAEEDGLASCTTKELAWTREMIQRLQGRGAAIDLTQELAELRRLETRPATPDAAAMLTRYFDIRTLKRRVMFKSPEVDFSSVICVDAPYTRRSQDTHGTPHQDEWVHESRFRSEMCASHGAKLLVLENVAGAAAPRQIAPPEGFGRPVAMFSFDLSFDARRAVFCMKPEDEKGYHLYEIGLDAKNFRQITSGGYSDIDPIYLPGDRYLFLSTRAEVYAQCGMWARSHILTRCDADGSNVYILSPATEPEYSPSLLEDGQVLFTRWEYVDKFANRIQSLWTMRPDGTGTAVFWGNQSEYPDHLGEARQVPGSAKVMFTGFGHHDVWAGCIGTVDPRQGRNFPHGIWKVTQDRPWPEVGDGPVPTPGATPHFHASGRYAAYKTPYPLSEELFLVSARSGDMGPGFMHSAHDPTIGKFKLYLMDIYGNRELVHEGDHNVLYAQPIRARKVPTRLPDLADMPGAERNSPKVRPGLFFSKNIFAGAPAEVRGQGKYLRVIETLPKNYSIGIVSSGGKPFGSPGPDTAWGAWGERFLPGKRPTPTTDISWGDSAIFSGPATSLSGPLAVKQEHGTVPIHEDGSVCFQAPPCRMLYFQVLDQGHRAIHTMRSWVSVRPGEQRGCVGCHEMHNATYANQPAAVEREPDAIQPPPWGLRSLSYVKDIQPIFDRACAECHSGNGQAVKTLDLTLRPDQQGAHRWGGVFCEPYLTLLLGKDHGRIDGACPGYAAERGYVAVPSTITTRYDTLPPFTCLSPKSRLVREAMDKGRCGKRLAPEDLRMLISWVDLWAMYRSDEDLRAIEDPPAEWFPLWTYAPRTKSAPRVRTEYAQDEFQRPEDRLVKTSGVKK